MKVDRVNLVCLQTRRLSAAKQSSLKALARHEPFHSSQCRRERKPVVEGRQPAPTSKAIAKDFFLSVLGAGTTKRDAKGYLSKFSAPVSAERKDGTKRDRESKILTGRHALAEEPYVRGVNLGNLFASTRAIESSPVFTQHEHARASHDRAEMHVAIVKVTNIDQLGDSTVNGVALTMSQLSRLGMVSVVVVDCASGSFNSGAGQQTWRNLVSKQATRLVTAIQKTGKTRAQVLDQALSSPDEQGEAKLNYVEMLLSTLRNGVITVVPPIGYNMHQQAGRLSANSAMLALARGLSTSDAASTDGQSEGISDEEPKISQQRQHVSVDRVILLDPAGGIPSTSRSHNSHIFINLEQEYNVICQELAEAARSRNMKPLSSTSQMPRGIKNGTTLETPQPAIGDSADVHQGQRRCSATNVHTENLDLLRSALSILPTSSSALIIRPEDVASSAFSAVSPAGVGTRQQRNPLIHNLLTDKPVFSPSLPAGRLYNPPTRSQVSGGEPDVHATFVKRGMPITMIPDPLIDPWSADRPGHSLTSLRDPRIDFDRLLHLIEDSFGRKLDVEHYLRRVDRHLAGLIIAGEYEGAAILTWERPASASGPTTPSVLSQRPPVPYLDKFAVLRRSQGAGGVADMLFNAMVRTCLPGGVVWRSRKDNPVNRWYFERADGTWKVPGSQWTLFWTGAELWAGEEGSRAGDVGGRDGWRRQRWLDYVAICKGIQASWADVKAPD